jgi:hypothetical protein
VRNRGKSRRADHLSGSTALPALTPSILRPFSDGSGLHGKLGIKNPGEISERNNWKKSRRKNRDRKRKIARKIRGDKSNRQDALLDALPPLVEFATLTLKY